MLQADWDPTFSESSYGFRPGRSAHQAVAQAQAVHRGRARLGGGHRSGEVLRSGQPRHPDGPGGAAGERPARARSSSAASLRAGVMENGLVSPTRRGDAARRSAVALAVEPGARRAGQGAGATRPPVRAATPTTATSTCAAERAGERVMESVTGFLTQASEAQGQRIQERGGSAVRSGSSWVSASRPGKAPQTADRARKALDRFKERVRELTRRTKRRRRLERGW